MDAPADSYEAIRRRPPVPGPRDAALAWVMRDALEGVRELALAAACPPPAPRARPRPIAGGAGGAARIGP
ncbi:hypothetical protein [Inmirania thermothiophila]|uniref:Uncharacterized protein n=1 Tax=Inmirania thermothiophila TaxID=1750597 RepID=A0A3N1Y1U0_9GAMM|nr:hypothetical protein [Inmirania thermothiophila]ROR32803.1 hypothetical protein EDC57_2015 [Inmirania thermothiophila]